MTTKQAVGWYLCSAYKRSFTRNYRIRTATLFFFFYFLLSAPHKSRKNKTKGHQKNLVRAVRELGTKTSRGSTDFYTHFSSLLRPTQQREGEWSRNRSLSYKLIWFGIRKKLNVSYTTWLFSIDIHWICLFADSIKLSSNSYHFFLRWFFGPCSGDINLSSFQGAIDENKAKKTKGLWLVEQVLVFVEIRPPKSGATFKRTSFISLRIKLLHTQREGRFRS